MYTRKLIFMSDQLLKECRAALQPAGRSVEWILGVEVRQAFSYSCRFAETEEVGNAAAAAAAARPRHPASRGRLSGL